MGSFIEDFLECSVNDLRYMYGIYNDDEEEVLRVNQIDTEDAL